MSLTSVAIIVSLSPWFPAGGAGETHRGSRKGRDQAVKHLKRITVVRTETVTDLDVVSVLLTLIAAIVQFINMELSK